MAEPNLYELYQPPSALNRAEKAMNNSLSSAQMMKPNMTSTSEAPGKTAGGGMSSAAGMGMAGYMAASASGGSVGGPAGAAIGAVVGLATYFLS